jgi:FkbM family methyltransferase
MLRQIKIVLDKLRWLILGKIINGEKLRFLPKLQLTLLLNRDWLVDFIIDRKGIFQPEIIEAIEQEFTEIQPQLFVDIGAYIGQMGLYVKKHFPDTIVWLVEPQTALVKRIKANAVKNKLEVNVFEMALGNSVGELKINDPIYPIDEYGKLNPGAVKFTYNETSDHTVEVNRIDELIAKHYPNEEIYNLLLKIDVENTEWEVLKGMEGLFKTCKKISIIIELNFTHEIEKQKVFENWISNYQIEIQPIEGNSAQKPYQGDYLLRWEKA